MGSSSIEKSRPRRRRPCSCSPKLETIVSSDVEVCGLNAAGEVYCVGAREVEGRRIDLPSTTVMLTAGTEHVCASTQSMEVWCWGPNRFAELGRPAPWAFAAPSVVARIPLMEHAP